MNILAYMYFIFIVINIFFVTLFIIMAVIKRGYKNETHNPHKSNPNYIKECKLRGYMWLVKRQRIRYYGPGIMCVPNKNYVSSLKQRAIRTEMELTPETVNNFKLLNKYVYTHNKLPSSRLYVDGVRLYQFLYNQIRRYRENKSNIFVKFPKVMHPLLKNRFINDTTLEDVTYQKFKVLNEYVATTECIPTYDVVVNDIRLYFFLHTQIRLHRNGGSSIYTKYFVDMHPILMDHFKCSIR